MGTKVREAGGEGGSEESGRGGARGASGGRGLFTTKVMKEVNPRESMLEGE